MQAALDAATQRIKTTLASVATRVSDGLGTLAQTSLRITERDLLNSAQFELRRGMNGLHRQFALVLQERIERDLSPGARPQRSLASANWQTLSLVDDAEMEERMFADRIGQAISHECDAELRELAAYMGTLLGTGRADAERNPLRPETLGAALYRSIETVSREAGTRGLLAREFGLAMAKAMPACYGDVVRDLQARGVRPAVLTTRGVEGPGTGGNSGYATLGGGRSERAEFDAVSNEAEFEDGAGADYPHRSTRAGAGSGSSTGPSTLGSSYGRTAHGPRTAGGAGGLDGSRGGGVPRDAQLMSLLRRLSAAGGPGGGTAVASAPRSVFDRSQWAPSRAERPRSTFGTHAGVPLPHENEAAAPDDIRGEGLTGLMAVNLIRAHREELLQASTGHLDHMVIDVVGSLFDQILSDSRVPPQMARQIARLQLPVLRVALHDAGFFASRRHPVRRFVNRIASLACAFDDFESGPGLDFLTRVRELVQEIVDGDFDQIELYGEKLGDLERFIATQAAGEADRDGAVGTLEEKETELRLQQRYRLQLQAALEPLALPPYLSEFLPQVWSQTLVLAAHRDGIDSESLKRFRRAGRDLVLSVQPKGSPTMRKKFLMQLPPLMKDLNEGMKLVGWPEAAQRDFFAKLLPAHAESMKLPPISELDHNMLGKRLEAIFAAPVPGTESLSPADSLPETDAQAIEPRFTPEEARRVGLVDESAVDWSGKVDIDLGAESGADLAAVPDIDLSAPDLPPSATGLPALDAALDLDLSDNAAAEAAEPTRGPALMEHIKLGFAYQMHLKDEWQKVRLTHVSPGRGFFVFSRGRQHQETISMTARMVARMCETGRLRAVESAYLIERATQRARRQLAAMKAPARV